jgi:hypothetical protein
MSRSASAAIILVCLLVPGLPARDVPLPKTATLSDWAKQSQGRYAYGMYMTGKKVGWSVEELKLAEFDGKPVLKSTNESYMATVYDGEKTVKEESMVIDYELDGSGVIVHALVKKKEDGKEIVREAVRQGKRLCITTKQGGRTLLRTVDMPKDTLAHQRDLETWLQGKHKSGESFKKYSASWDDADINQKEIWTFKETKKILLAGLKKTVVAVEIDLDGGKMKAEVFPDSRVFTGTLGGLLTLKLEKESAARKLDGTTVDLMAAMAIVVDRDIGLARKVDSLTLQVTGLDDFKLPVSHRQNIKVGKESSTVEILRDTRVKESAPLTKEELKRYTRTSPRMQCEHEAIRFRSKRIIGDEKDPLKAARLLETWVYKHIRKSYQDNADTALEILDHKAGDCTEHSLLFVALARAAGIPAREVGGVAYVKGKKPMFGWHAWAEIHDGHQWVSIDPTWHQVYVDGTHIKLSEGSRDLAWANVAGKIKIKVLQVKTRK